MGVQVTHDGGPMRQQQQQEIPADRVEGDRRCEEEGRSCR